LLLAKVNAEGGFATLVNPDEVAVEAEGAAFHAGSVGVLALYANGFDTATHAAAGVAVVGALAMNGFGAGLTVARTAGETRAARKAGAATALGGHEELTAAAFGYPDGVTIEAEGAAFHASGAGKLAKEANVTNETVHAAALGAAVVGGTGYHLFITASGAAGAPPVRAARATGAASEIISASPWATIVVTEAVTRAEAALVEIERVLRMSAEGKN
jgi:hypothetical protein